MGGAALIIDIKTIGLIAHGDSVGAQLFKDLGCSVVGSAMGAIKRDPKPAETEARGQRALTEFDITTCGIADTACLA